MHPNNTTLLSSHHLAGSFTRATITSLLSHFPRGQKSHEMAIARSRFLHIRNSRLTDNGFDS